MIKIKKITFQPADIYDLFANPVIGLKAPSTGNVNNILGVTNDLDFATIAYNTSSFIYGKSGATSSVFTGLNVLNSAVDINIPASKTVTQQLPFSTTKDFMITTNIAVTTGDSPVDTYIIYEETPIE